MRLHRKQAEGVPVRLPLLTDTFCRWWPGLEPVACGFRITLLVFRRTPPFQILSSCRDYFEYDVAKAMALLGDGYVFIWYSQSDVHCVGPVTLKERIHFSDFCDHLANQLQTSVDACERRRSQHPILPNAKH
jgi:hypothetical protein